MSSRETVLKTLRASKRPQAPAENWAAQRVFNDLSEQFTRALTSAHGKVVRARDLQEACTRLAELLEEHGAKQVVANNETPLKDIELRQRFPQYRWHIVDQSDGDLRSFCSEADVGITGADGAFAETGSLVLTSGHGKSRFTSLLPPVHIALLPTSLLQSDIFAWQRGIQGQFPTWVGFISGPSKTGDIEGILILGVHGPRNLTVILYND